MQQSQWLFNLKTSSKTKLTVTLQIDTKTKYESDNSEQVVAMYRSRVKSGRVTSDGYQLSNTWSDIDVRLSRMMLPATEKIRYWMYH